MYVSNRNKPHWSLLYPSSINVIFYINVHFIAFKLFRNEKYVQREGCLVPQKYFLKVLLAGVHAEIRFIKDVQHSGGIRQPRAKKQPPASQWHFDGKTFLKWWIGGVECTGEATGDCCWVSESHHDFGVLLSQTHTGHWQPSARGGARQGGGWGWGL